MIVHDNKTLSDFVRLFSVVCSATSIKTVSNGLLSTAFLPPHSMSNLEDGPIDSLIDSQSVDKC